MGLWSSRQSEDDAVDEGFGFTELPKKLSFDEAHEIFHDSGDDAPPDDGASDDIVDDFNERFDEAQEAGKFDKLDQMMGSMSADDMAFVIENTVRMSLTKRRAAIVNHFKSSGMTQLGLFHEMTSLFAHIDLRCFERRPEDDFVVFVTCGMSDNEMPTDELEAMREPGWPGGVRGRRRGATPIAKSPCSRRGRSSRTARRQVTTTGSAAISSLSGWRRRPPKRSIEMA